MAKMTIIECDSCHSRIEDHGDVALVTLTEHHVVYSGDFCPDCASKLRASLPVRRGRVGRRPKTREAIVVAGSNGN